MALSPSRPQTRATLARLWLLSLSGLLALLLAACGAPAPLGGSPTTSPSASSTSVTHPTAEAGENAHPCPGVYTGGFHPTVTLANTSNSVTGSAHMGDTIELRLDGGHTWRLTSITPAGAMTPTSQDGMFDRANNQCVWIFQANAPGDVVISFIGGAFPCDSEHPCSLIALPQTFTLHVA